MSTWTIILIASLASYALRALPIVYFHHIPMATDGVLYRFLNYAAFAVMGGIIYSALLGTTYYDNWAGHFTDLGAACRLATLALAVVSAALFKGVFKTLFICLTFFIVLISVIGA